MSWVHNSFRLHNLATESRDVRDYRASEIFVAVASVDGGVNMICSPVMTEIFRDFVGSKVIMRRRVVTES